MKRVLPAILVVLTATGCPEGERCDMETYDRGCDGERSWSACSDKYFTGMKKLWPTVVRGECEPHAVCLDVGETTTCVAEPAEPCDVLDQTRCVDGIKQKCRDVDAITLNSKVLYWYWVGGLSCDGSEDLP